MIDLKKFNFNEEEIKKIKDFAGSNDDTAIQIAVDWFLDTQKIEKRKESYEYQKECKHCNESWENIDGVEV